MKHKITFQAIFALIAFPILISFSTKPKKEAGIVHPFHVSISKLEFDPDNKRIKTTHKIFLDDLNLQLQDIGEFTAGIEKINNDEKVAAALKTYCQEYFSVELRGEQTPMEWLGYEIDYDIVYIYVVYPTYKKLKEPIKVKSAFLIDLYGDQMNIVHFTANQEMNTVYFSRTDNKPKILVEP